MTQEQAQLRALLAERWSPGESGKALLLTDGRLRSWRTLAFGSPHHAVAQQTLGIATEAVAAYLAIEPDGVVTVWTLVAVDDADSLVEQALAADARLRCRPSPAEEWTFGDDETPPAT